MKVEFDLSEKQIEFLKQYAMVYDDERKVDATRNPIVLVQEKEKRYVSSDCNYSDYEYGLILDNCNMCEDGYYKSIDDIEKEVRKYLNDRNIEKIDEIIYDMYLHIDGIYSYVDWQYNEKNVNIEVKVHYFEYYYKTKAYFLTKAEALKYTKYQGHNLTKPRIYTDFAGYNNEGDFVELSKMLLDIGKLLCNKE
ncbi:MAG: hypothetical protein ACTTHM_11055 [Peptoanaerobacter stomatis]|uniref:hypothetical protein n=1 Tax=Peptoanaerobacter stomatis TaxID=796937 RepID=UPI003FA11C4D